MDDLPGFLRRLQSENELLRKIDAAKKREFPRLPPLPPTSKGWVYIAIAKEPPTIMTLEEWQLEERWRQVRIVDEGGWIER